MNKKRNLESLQKDALKRGKEFERKVVNVNESFYFGAQDKSAFNIKTHAAINNM